MFSRIPCRTEIALRFPFVIPAFVSCKRFGRTSRQARLVTRVWTRTKSLPFLFLNYIYRRGTNREYSILCLEVGIFSIAGREGRRGREGEDGESFVSRVEILFLNFFSFFLRESWISKWICDRRTNNYDREIIIIIIWIDNSRFEIQVSSSSMSSLSFDR